MAYANQRLIRRKPRHGEFPLHFTVRVDDGVGLQHVLVPVHVEVLRRAPREEEHALVPHARVHAAEGLVQDHEVRLLHQRPQQQRHPLRGERHVPEPQLVRPVRAPRRLPLRALGRPLGTLPRRFARVCRVQLRFEPPQTGIHRGVVLVDELRGPEEGVGPGVLEDLADRQVLGEEGVDLGTGLPDAGLDVEDGDARFARPGQAGAGEDPDGERVGLRVVGADEGEERGFAGAVGAEDAPTLATADGPLEALLGLAVTVLVPGAKDGFGAILDDDIVHLDKRLAEFWCFAAFQWKAFGAVLFAVPHVHFGDVFRLIILCRRRWRFSAFRFTALIPLEIFQLVAKPSAMK